MRYLPSLPPLGGLAARLVVMYHLTRAVADPTVPGFFLRSCLGVGLFLPDQLRRLAAHA